MAMLGFVIGFIFLLLVSIFVVVIPIVLSSVGYKGKKELYLFIIPITLHCRSPSSE